VLPLQQLEGNEDRLVIYTFTNVKEGDFEGYYGTSGEGEGKWSSFDELRMTE